ncbi:hypothetical protein Ga0123462_0858 [Mariprofundus ferrinatatus]|uniref:Uncharacterized protein n=1 Tax=Mariprofundus ferrinatatus TaxID=1921087 RepID=A0A2K8L373_9PROT|nr:hypothetical protein [Mariprofundus ferrinatatus]ATX81727.1 hypothetical protein Ga0123462_0858 [Mariprofundus ferrinatatus]
MPDFSFNPALSQMDEEDLEFWGPKDFQTYSSENGFSRINAPTVISIDSLEALRPELKDTNTMVLRLGRSSSSGTQFGLVKSRDVRDFFLVDSVIFEGLTPQTFLPPMKYSELYPFQLIGAQSETSLVNFGCSSGLLAKALGLNFISISAPATGASTYTFNVKVGKQIPPIRHTSGQVQFDAVFVGERGGKQCLFVLEAKNRGRHRSLAKHKLVYPILALAPNVPSDMEIIPVYLKTIEHAEGVCFQVAECSYPDPRNELSDLREVSVVNASSYVVPSLSMGG